MADVAETGITLELLEKQFTDAIDTPSQQTSRREGELHRQYYDGIQWTATELATLQARNQAPIVDNRIKDKVEHLLGLERRTRTDPKAYPRNPSDEKPAEAATDALRFVADQNDFQQTRSYVAENMLVEGCGACEVIAEKVADGKNPKITIRKIRWDRFFFDPYSRDADFRDATYLGIVTWMDAEAAKQKWPAQADRITEAMASKANDETFEDRPRWVDGKRKRVQIIQTECIKDGTWMRALWFKGGMLEQPQPSYYLDENGQPECCIIAQSLYVDAEGGRYGIVRRYKTLQDEINHRRSKALHILNTRQIKAEKGAVDDVNKTRTEASRPDGYIEYNPGMNLEIETNQDMAEGQFRLLIEAQNSLAVTGPNAALQGNSGSLSGRAKELDQEGGAIQLGVYLDSVRYFQRRVMRASWNRIRQFWDQEMWIRVRDDEGRMMFSVLNQRVTAGELEAEKIAKMSIPPEQKQQMVMQIAQNPNAQQPVVKNPVADLDVDIIIDETPDTPNIQAEQFAQFVLLAKAGVVFPPDIYIEASALRNKEKLMQKLKGASDDPAAQAEQQEQVQRQKRALDIAEAQAVAEVENTQADTALKVSETHENEVDAATELALAGKEMATPIEKPRPSPGPNGR